MMAKTELTVRQIMDLGIWEKVCEYNNWSPYILREGLIGEDELVIFDSNFEKHEENKIKLEVDDTWERKNYEYTVISKVDHLEDSSKSVVTIAIRKFGTDEYSYDVREVEDQIY